MRKPIDQVCLGLHKRSVKLLTTIGCLTLTVSLSDSASAQINLERQKNPPFEIIYGGKNPAPEKSQRIFTPTASARNAAETVNQPIRNNEQRQKATQLEPADVARMNRLTTQLVAQSRDAWLRGLLDQSSYTAWLDIAATTRIQIARHQGDQHRVVQVLREQVNLWNEAVGQLEEFNQPASHGWQADLSHSRVMALRAAFSYSVATGRTVGPRDKKAYADLVQEHYELRRHEFEARRGSAADYIMAARMLDERLVVPQQKVSDSGNTAEMAMASFRIDSPVAMRHAIAEVQEPVFLLAFPVVIEANDPFDDIASIQRASRFVQFLDTPTDNRDPLQLLEQLDLNAEEISAEQFARYEVGTATPGGMLQQWWLHESLANSVTDNVFDSDFGDSQTQRLEQIHQLAVSIQDRRGRNAADVAAAEVLWAARQLDLEHPPVQEMNSPDEATEPVDRSTDTVEKIAPATQPSR